MATITDAPATSVALARRFTTASRSQERFVSNQNFVGDVPGSIAPIQIPASGYIRKLSILVNIGVTFASGAALVAGDAPFNIINSITLTDAQGTPIMVPISGYQLYLRQKYSPILGKQSCNGAQDPRMSPEFKHGLAGQVYTGQFRLDLDLEIDSNTGYGSIANLDSNTSPQLRIDFNANSTVVTGVNPSAQSLTFRVSQTYWAPIGKTIDGAPVQSTPPGLGDYLETRRQTFTVNAASENTVRLTSSTGGVIAGLIFVSRTGAGVRTQLQRAANIGLSLDNVPIQEGIPIEEREDQLRRYYGFPASDVGTSMVPLTVANPQTGIDTGVVVFDLSSVAGGRDSWLNVRSGAALELKITPGVNATVLDVITLLGQVNSPDVFYGPSALV